MPNGEALCFCEGGEEHCYASIRTVDSVKKRIRIMTQKERVLATIRGESVDKIPVHHLQFAGHVASVILGREDVCVGGEHLQRLEMNALWEGEEAHRAFLEKSEADAVAIADACGHDILRLQYWRWREKPTLKVDDNTFVFGDPDGDGYTMTYRKDLELFERRIRQGGVEKSATRKEGETEYTEGELLEETLLAEDRARNDPPLMESNAKLKATIEKYPDYLVRHGGGTASVDMASARALMAVAYWPDLVARKLMANARRFAKDIPAMAAAGLDVDISGADFCSRKGPTLSPAMFRDVVIPALKVIADACHKHGMYYFYTSDGNFWPVADDLFNVAGIDGWLETDRSAGMDLRRLRERFSRVTFQGNIRSQLLHAGTRDAVVRETMDCLEVAYELGGVIVGVSNLIMPGTPPENILAMLEAIEKNR